MISQLFVTSTEDAVHISDCNGSCPSNDEGFVNIGKLQTCQHIIKLSAILIKHTVHTNKNVSFQTPSFDCGKLTIITHLSNNKESKLQSHH